MRLLCLVLAVLWSAGCSGDPRPAALQQAVELAAALIANPQMQPLATRPGDPEALVAAVFSEEGRKLWPKTPTEESGYEHRASPGYMPARIAFLSAPNIPWAVVIKARKEPPAVVIEGYGGELSRPLYTRIVAIGPN